MFKSVHVPASAASFYMIITKFVGKMKILNYLKEASSRFDGVSILMRGSDVFANILYWYSGENMQKLLTHSAYVLICG